MEDRGKWVKNSTYVMAATQPWEQGAVQEPKVIVEADGSLTMFYTGGWANPAIGRATSTDGGNTWIKYPNNPIIGNGAGGVAVACHPGARKITTGTYAGQYEVIFSDTSSPPCNLLRALSTDGITFTANPIPILEQDGTYPYPANACIVDAGNGREVMLYTAQANGTYVWTQLQAQRCDSDGWVWKKDQRGSCSSQQISGGTYSVNSYKKINNYFYGWSNTSTVGQNLPTDIYSFRSKDLWNWEHLNGSQAALSRTLPFEYDQVADGFVLEVPGKVVMLYSGLNNSTDVSYIGRAEYVGTLSALMGVSVPVGSYTSFGDSITYGYPYTADTGNMYVNQLASYLNYTVNNVAVSSSQMADQAFLINSVTPGNLSTIFLGTNDTNIYGNDATKRTAAINFLRSLALYATGASVVKALDMTKTGGTWSAQTGIGDVTGYSVTALNAQAVCTVTGSSIYIGYSLENASASESVFQVYVDNTLIDTVTLNGTYVGNTYLGRSYSTACARYTGFTNTSHTVKIVSTSSTKKLILNYVAGSSQTGLKPVFITNIPKKGGYLGTDGDTNVAAYGTAIANMVNDMKADGLPVNLADIYSTIVTSTDLYSDNLHLNAYGQAKVATAIENAIYSYNHPTAPGTYNVDALIVAAGGGGASGGGGNYYGGGGAAGQVGVHSAMSITTGTSYPIVIGAGGAQEVAGGNSSFAGFTVNGGLPGTNTTGGAQGSFTGGLPYAGIGPGGGGAGAAANGNNGSSDTGGYGGSPVVNSFSGTSKNYGSGGGGAGSAHGGQDGEGGGGYGAWNPSNRVGHTSVPNCGGGGGGGITGGGSGCSGIVIIRYLGSQRGTGGTITSVGGYTIHTFTSNGTYIA